MDERRQILASEPSADAAPVRRDLTSNPQLEFDFLRSGKRSEFLFISELRRRSRAEEQPDRLMRHVERVMQHRSERRNAGPAGNEKKTPLAGLSGKRKTPEWTIEIDERSRFEAQIAARISVGVDPDKELDRMVALRLLGRDCNGVRPPPFTAVRADENCLPREVGKCIVGEIDDDGPRARRCGAHLTDRSRQQHVA